jgi:MFS family permease
MAVANGIPRDRSASLISICGVANTVGRILVGFLTDTFHVSSTAIYLVALTIAAATNFLFPWCSDYTVIAICSGVFGLCMGELYMLIPNIWYILQPYLKHCLFSNKHSSFRYYYF